ncbi:MAG: bifunctional 5,10-methylenetetrahydrofolate dehydrogenase/5,10-methenyltetrahydrofolate cyclohydrolase [Elusimicrobiota bacterium]
MHRHKTDTHQGMTGNNLKILSGNDISSVYRARLKDNVSRYLHDNRAPSLKIVVIGTDSTSLHYARLTKDAGTEDGFLIDIIHLEETDTEELIGQISFLNDDNRTDGILIQQPFPPDIDMDKVLSILEPRKDVDGQTLTNRCRFLAGDPFIVPAVAKAVLTLLKGYSIEMCGKKAAVIGRSWAVGLPIAIMLIRENATVTICHSRSVPLEYFTHDADIIVSCAGVPGLVSKKHVKPGSSVIDAGTTKIDDSIEGDVDFETTAEIASVSPVKGGVGILSLVYTLENTYELYRKNIHCN